MDRSAATRASGSSLRAGRGWSSACRAPAHPAQRCGSTWSATNPDPARHGEETQDALAPVIEGRRSARRNPQMDGARCPHRHHLMSDPGDFDLPQKPGAEICADGVRFTVRAPSASSVSLCLFDSNDEEIERHDLKGAGDELFSGFVRGVRRRRALRASRRWAVAARRWTPVRSLKTAGGSLCHAHRSPVRLRSAAR